MSGKWKGKRVAVLMGGNSKEREISFKTGTAILDGLRRRGYDAERIEFTDGMELVTKLSASRPDVAVVALHGKFGEDGCVQGLLEMMRIPYTGGGVLASSVGMHKVVCKRIAREIGIPCVEDQLFCAESDDPDSFPSKLDIGYPVIVKPSREGSTINMTIVKRSEDLPAALRIAAESDGDIIVERYVKGREVTVGVLNGEALPTLEIAPKSGFYDFTSKYTKGMTEYIVPARIGDGMAKKLQMWSEEICRAIECEGTARVDYIVPSDDAAYFLEVNTIPGMTELSLVPKAAAHVGMDFDEVCERLLDGARLKVEV